MAEANGQAEPGTLKTFIGQDAVTLRNASTFKVDLRRVEDTMLYATDKPVIVEYGEGGDALRFPAASSLSLSIKAGHVVDVQLMPQVAVLTVAQAIDLVTRIDSLLGEHGWTRPDRGLSFAEATIRLSAAQETAQRVHFARWQRPGGDTLDIQVESSPPLGWSLKRLIGGNHRQCMVTVTIGNEPAYQRFSAEMRRLRIQDGLGDIPSRPIDLPAYLSRVRP